MVWLYLIWSSSQKYFRCLFLQDWPFAIRYLLINQNPRWSSLSSQRFPEVQLWWNLQLVSWLSKISPLKLVVPGDCNKILVLIYFQSKIIFLVACCTDEELCFWVFHGRLFLFHEISNKNYHLKQPPVLFLCTVPYAPWFFVRWSIQF